MNHYGQGPNLFGGGAPGGGFFGCDLEGLPLGGLRCESCSGCGLGARSVSCDKHSCLSAALKTAEVNELAPARIFRSDRIRCFLRNAHLGVTTLYKGGGELSVDE